MIIIYECSKKENKLDIKQRNKKQTNKQKKRGKAARYFSCKYKFLPYQAA